MSINKQKRIQFLRKLAEKGYVSLRHAYREAKKKGVAGNYASFSSDYRSVFKIEKGEYHTLVRSVGQKRTRKIFSSRVKALRKERKKPAIQRAVQAKKVERKITPKITPKITSKILKKEIKKKEVERKVKRVEKRVRKTERKVKKTKPLSVDERLRKIMKKRKPKTIKELSNVEHSLYNLKRYSSKIRRGKTLITPKERRLISRRYAKRIVEGKWRESSKPYHAIISAWYKEGKNYQRYVVELQSDIALTEEEWLEQFIRYMKTHVNRYDTRVYVFSERPPTIELYRYKVNERMRLIQKGRIGPVVV